MLDAGSYQGLSDAGALRAAARALELSALQGLTEAVAAPLVSSMVVYGCLEMAGGISCIIMPFP